MQMPNQPPKKVAQIANDLSTTFCQATQLAAVAASRAGAKARGITGPDHVSSVYACSVGLIGGLHILASMIGHHGDKERESVEIDDIAKLINPTSTLLAAVLVQTMAPSATMEGKLDDGNIAVGSVITFSPEIMLDSVQQVERITGRPIDGWVKPSLLKALRKLTENSEEPMNRFLAQRRTTPGNLH